MFLPTNGEVYCLPDTLGVTSDIVTVESRVTTRSLVTCGEEVVVVSSSKVVAVVTSFSETAVMVVPGNGTTFSDLSYINNKNKCRQ